MPLCDKCGKEVLTSNNAILLEAIIQGENVELFSSPGRHLLTTEDCEGSPSRAQYLEGQPRDLRPGNQESDSQFEAYVPVVRRAYAELKILVLY